MANRLSTTTSKPFIGFLQARLTQQNYCHKMTPAIFFGWIHSGHLIGQLIINHNIITICHIFMKFIQQTQSNFWVNLQNFLLGICTIYYEDYQRLIHCNNWRCIDYGYYLGENLFSLDVIIHQKVNRISSYVDFRCDIWTQSYVMSHKF